MFFSRITVNTPIAVPDELVKLVNGDTYAIHKLLWRLFPDDPEAKRDFIFRREEGNGWPYFFMVSRRQPQAIEDCIRVESKPYQPKLTSGQPLTFSLRVNPVVTKKSDDGKRQVRHDVVMNAKRELAFSSQGKAEVSSGELQYATGVKWLESRAARSGFDFAPEQIKVFGYQQHRIKKRQQKKTIRFSVLDFKGKLAVIDPERFCQALFFGIGPAKAFGCGLMLVKRI